MVLFTVVFLPLIMTALPLVFLYITNVLGEDATGGSDMPAQFTSMCGTLSNADCMQYFMINQFLLMFMIMPLAIPVAIAAYSVVGEKTTRSLEPLLATPITTVELLIGKGLSAVIPAILATWVGFAVFVLAGPLVGMSRATQAMVLSPTWLTAILIVGPLMAAMAVNFALIVSSRVTDPRAAEQISMIIILPVLGVLFAQIGGVITVNLTLMIVAAVIILIVDAILVAFGAQMFQRETILTKWK
jgi:ABC-2 type transport system permease protein